LAGTNGITKPAIGDLIEAEILADATGWQLARRGIANDKSIRGFHANCATVAQGMVRRDGALDEKPKLSDGVSTFDPKRTARALETILTYLKNWRGLASNISNCNHGPRAWFEREASK
jgi:hypothetical protein